MSEILSLSQQIVDANGFSDKITLVQGKLEDIDLPVDKVPAPALLSVLPSSPSVSPLVCALFLVTHRQGRHHRI